MADPSGRIIPLPIRSNFRDGLTALEYFISTHGARKGLADTALRTADAGYLTRRLVDVAQDQIINTVDCGTESGIWVRRSDDVAGQPYYDRVVGRAAARNIVDPKSGELIVARNEIVEEAHALRHELPQFLLVEAMLAAAADASRRVGEQRVDQLRKTRLDVLVEQV